jgi:hypothetical protein
MMMMTTAFHPHLNKVVMGLNLDGMFTGVGIRDLAGDAFDFLRRSSHLIQEHYPERCRVIIIANAPGWFAVLWKMIWPLINENTQKKIRITKVSFMLCFRGPQLSSQMTSTLDIRTLVPLLSCSLAMSRVSVLKMAVIFRRRGRRLKRRSRSLCTRTTSRSSMVGTSGEKRWPHVTGCPSL